MSPFVKRTLPPTLTNGSARADCKRRTLDTEILSSLATSAVVRSSPSGVGSIGIPIKEQYRIGTRNWPMCNSTVSLFRPSA